MSNPSALLSDQPRKDSEIVDIFLKKYLLIIRCMAHLKAKNRRFLGVRGVRD
jgi:hypothetical protein